MKFVDGVSFGEARAYVNKREAAWREEYMKSGMYRDMSFDEYIAAMGITEYRDGLRKALDEFYGKEVEVSA